MSDDGITTRDLVSGWQASVAIERDASAPSPDATATTTVAAWGATEAQARRNLQTVLEERGVVEGGAD